jgi:enamine deaminase RidA (YjgF/YER057c/UK114 family)
MNIDDRLRDMGLTLPTAPKPVAAYIPAMRVGELLMVSGQLPLKDGTLLATGPVGAGVTLEQAQTAARQCVLNALAIAKAELGGDWSRLVHAVRLGVFVQSPDGYADQPKVANGASELLVALMGEAGRHVRAAVGVNALPLNATVEVEATFRVRD